MRYGRTLVACLSLLVGTCTGTAAAGVSVGETAPDFTLPDLDGQEHSLADHRGRLVVLEWVNPNCPFSERHAREGTMIDLVDHHPDLVWLGINSTAEDHRDYLTPEQHAEYNTEHGIDYPILYDVTGEVGHAYGAKTTPHMFVIDEQGKVVYAGAIDDDPYARSDSRTNYVTGALEALEQGRKPEPSSTKPYGCSVKYGG
ncbi:MAG: redoxin domain-containing protein [Thermoanaerobaculia bacterium]|nr:redoxin domain-containing protein [Thermoanaerobaculia bacterium]